MLLASGHGFFLVIQRSDVMGNAELADAIARLAQLHFGNGQHDPEIIRIIEALNHTITNFKMKEI